MLLSRFDLLCLMPLSAIFQLYNGDQFQQWKKPEYPERTTGHGQATGKLYHLRLRVKCTLFCNLQSRVQTPAILVIVLYELLGSPTNSLSHPGPLLLHRVYHHAKNNNSITVIPLLKTHPILNCYSQQYSEICLNCVSL